MKICIFHIGKTLQTQPITGKDSDQHSRASSLRQNGGVIVIPQAEVLVRYRFASGSFSSLAEILVR